MKLAGRGVPQLLPAVPLPVPEGHLLAGKYRVEKVIGAGGMGVVASAVHIHLGQRVAIKFLLPHAALDDQSLARFAREARALARIESEHVGRVIDVGELDSGEPYTVLECLSGRNLAELLGARGALEISEAVGYVIEACQAMSEAHALGIIHRDLKPENLFLAERADGSKIIKVIDFGVSKFESEASVLTAPWVVTATSAVLGSPLYMSPEQLRAAHDVDARTDLWSLGVTLYELLAGEGPFRWSTLPELCAAILKDPPRPLRELRPDAPPRLEAVVMRCLERDPSRRPPSAGALAHDLRPFERGGALVAPSLPLAAPAPVATSGAAVTLTSDLAAPTGMTTVALAQETKPRRKGAVRAGLLLVGLGVGTALLVTGNRPEPPSVQLVASTPALVAAVVAEAPSATSLARPLLPGAALAVAATTPIASAASPPAAPRPLLRSRIPYRSDPQNAFDHRK